MNLHKISIALIFVLFLFNFAAFAHNDRIKVEFVVFESSRDYTLFAGKPIDYDSFKRAIAAEESSNISALISRKSLNAALGTESIAGPTNHLSLNDGKSDFQSKFYNNVFSITPFLIGGEDNATSEIVSAQIFFETAKTDANLKVKSLPSIGLSHFSSHVECRLNTFTIVGGGASTGKDNRLIYFGVYYSRS